MKFLKKYQFLKRTKQDQSQLALTFETRDRGHETGTDCIEDKPKKMKQYFQ